MNDAQVLLVLTHMPDADSAQRMADALVASRAAACVNILGACHAVYRWQGKIESVQELPLLIKTTRAAYARVEVLIREHHPYELPEIIAVPVDAGSAAYLQWVVQETTLP